MKAFIRTDEDLPGSHICLVGGQVIYGGCGVCVAVPPLFYPMSLIHPRLDPSEIVSKCKNRRPFLLLLFTLPIVDQKNVSPRKKTPLFFKFSICWCFTSSFHSDHSCNDLWQWAGFGFQDIIEYWLITEWVVHTPHQQQACSDCCASAQAESTLTVIAPCWAATTHTQFTYRQNYHSNCQRITAK